VWAKGQLEAVIGSRRGSGGGGGGGGGYNKGRAAVNTRSTRLSKQRLLFSLFV